MADLGVFSTFSPIPTISTLSIPNAAPPPVVVASIDPEIQTLFDELADTEGDPAKLDAWDLLGTVSGSVSNSYEETTGARQDLLQALLQLESPEWADQNAYQRFQNLATYYTLGAKTNSLDKDPRTHNRVLIEGVALYLASQKNQSYLDVLDDLTTEPNFTGVIGDSLTEGMGGLAVENPDATRGFHATAATFVSPFQKNNNSYTCYRPQALWREGSDENLWSAWRSTMAGVHTPATCMTLAQGRLTRNAHPVAQTSLALFGASGARTEFFLDRAAEKSAPMNLQGYTAANQRALHLPDTMVLADIPPFFIEEWDKQNDGRTMAIWAGGSNDSLLGTATGPDVQDPKILYEKSYAMYKKQGAKADLVLGTGPVSAVNMLARIEELSAGLPNDARKAPPVFYTLREGSLYQTTFNKRHPSSVDWNQKTASVNGVTYQLQKVSRDGFTRYRLVLENKPSLDANGQSIFVMDPKARMYPLDYARFKKGEGIPSRLLYDKTAIAALDKHMAKLRDADLRAMERVAREDSNTTYLHIQATEVIEEFLYMGGDRDNGVSLRAWLLTEDFAHPSQLGYDLYYLGLARRLHMEAGLYRKLPEADLRSLDKNYQTLVQRVSKTLGIPAWLLENYRTGTDAESNTATKIIQQAVLRRGRAGYLPVAGYKPVFMGFGAMALAPVPGLKKTCTVTDLVVKPDRCFTDDSSEPWAVRTDAPVVFSNSQSVDDTKPKQQIDRSLRAHVRPREVISQIVRGPSLD